MEATEPLPARLLLLLHSFATKTSQFLVSVTVIGVFAAVMVALYVLVTVSGPRPILLAHSEDYDSFLAKGLKRLLIDLKLLTKAGVLCDISSKVSALTADDFHFYFAFYKLIHEPTDPFIQRERYVVPLMARMGTKKRLCNRVKGRADEFVVVDSKLRTWSANEGATITSLCNKLRDLASGTRTCASDASGSNEARVMHSILNAHLLLNHYQPDISRAFDMRKTSFGVIQFTILTEVLGGMWRNILNEVSTIWNVPDRLKTAFKVGARLYKAYSNPQIQKTMMRLPSMLSSSAGEPNKTVRVG